MVVPVQPVTPVPNFFEYQPNDFYDLRPGPSEPYNTTRNHSEWFDASPSTKKKLSMFTQDKEMPFVSNRSYYSRLMIPGMGRKKFDQMVKTKLRTAKRHKKLYVPEADINAGYDTIFQKDKDLRRPAHGLKKR